MDPQAQAAFPRLFIASSTSEHHAIDEGRGRVTRLHADDIDVERGIINVDGAEPIEGPVRFVWAERSYVVHSVLDHWVEAGSWWRRTGRSRTGPGGAAPGITLGITSGIACGIDDGEREVWRVEASPGRAFGSGVYDVSFDWAAGGWTLRRALD